MSFNKAKQVVFTQAARRISSVGHSCENKPDSISRQFGLETSMVNGLKLRCHLFCCVYTAQLADHIIGFEEGYDGTRHDTG